MQEDLRNRFRRDFSNQPMPRPHASSSPGPKLSTPEASGPTERQVGSDLAKVLPKKSYKKAWLTVILASIMIAAALTGWILWDHRPKEPTKPVHISVVPSTISGSVNFPIYYPDQSKLQAGYRFDKSSFKVPVKNGVTYWVTYEANKRIVFSLQTKPSDSELQSFNNNYIPLRNDFQTNIGQAEIGAYNNHGAVETLVSLPVTNGPWIIITAPKDINQNQLKQVIGSLHK